MRLIALRHGRSQYNVLSLCNDDPRVPVDLTEEGVRQATRAAASLATEPLQAIHSSPLPRAVRTAEIVAKPHGLPVDVDPRLADIRSGFEGRPVTEYLAAIAHDPVGARVGGESLRDYAARVGAFLDWLAERPTQSVLLVAHEETLRVIQARCEGLALSEVAGRSFENCRPYAFVLN